MAESYLHAATVLVLKSWWKVPAFLSLSRRVTNVMPPLEGYLGHALTAELGGLRFFTHSLWTGRAAVGRLMATPEHRDAVRRMDELSGEGSLTVVWTSASKDLDWAEAKRQLAENGVPVSRPR